MSGWIVFLILVVGCYLVGGLPFGFIIGRLHGVDIRKAGSGNIGATNVGRLLGRPWGILVFALDVSKGLCPTLLAGHLIGAQGVAASWSGVTVNTLWLICGICCIMGHNYPVYLGFRGGKGVATSLGVVLGVYPYLTIAGLLAFGLWAAVTLVSRYVSLGSVCAACALPVFFAVSTLWRGSAAFLAHLPMLGFVILLSGLVIYRHRPNLARLRAGTEAKIGARSRPAKGGA